MACAAVALLLILCASAAGASQNVWTVVQSGLPAANSTYSLGTVFARGSTAFVAVNNHPQGSALNGLYALVNETWQRHSPPTNQYGTGSCVVSRTNGSIYCLQQNNLYVLNESSPDPASRRWVAVPLLLPNTTRITVDAIAPGRTRLLLQRGAASPALYALPLPGGGTLQDLGFPFAGLDSKQGQLLEDGRGRVWYRSYGSGVFVLDGGWGKASNVSGVLSVSNGLDVYLSYEVTAGTQLSSFFQYIEPRSTAPAPRQGYGGGGPPIASAGVVSLGGRFPDVVVAPGRKWRLPAPWADLGLTPDQSKSVFVAWPAVTNASCIVARVEYGPLSLKRMMRLCANFGTLPSYSTNLRIDLGTYLAGPGPNVPVAAAWLPGGNLLVAINSPSPLPGRPAPLPLQPSGSGNQTYPRGSLLVLGGRPVTGSTAAGAPPNATVEAAWRLRGPLAAVAVQRGSSGLAALATNDTLGVLNASSGAWLWQQPRAGPVARLAFDAAGVLAVLTADKIVQLYDGFDGSRLAPDRNHSAWRSWVLDIEILSTRTSSGRGGLYYLCGFDQTRLPSGLPIQVAYLDAYRVSDGALAWRRFSFNSGLLAALGADTRLYRVALAGDGVSLDVLGHSAGTNTIFLYNGTRINGTSALTRLDAYTDTSNTGSAHVAYVARFHANTGAFLAGQLNMPRLSSGKSNTFGVGNVGLLPPGGDVASDPSGRTFVAGVTASALPVRPAQTVNGVPVGAYKGDPALLALAPGYKARYAWSSLNRLNATGTAHVLACRAGRLAVLSTIQDGESFTTPGALATANSNPAGNIHLAVINTAANGWV
ncbi:hypothetical protein HYH03_001726 [Edaphochlamys debaryana]|uniref:Uncharacterized protein n=1 Tax=Edaphochlamys debaryana TaxID=47281 RepID=A0A835YE92_9CHLO|nr:hypothetical protein HYH03_001726 [Edaphochlamys debaryana]|eukprot:KAG2500144.1 hypothetical protein HYH03_001726 [Edaphochlamys debaryana]